MGGTIAIFSVYKYKLSFNHAASHVATEATIVNKSVSVYCTYAKGSGHVLFCSELSTITRYYTVEISVYKLM